jgi:hypothetical protein
MAKEKPKTIGSTAQVNEALQKASKITGIEAPVFNEETGAKVESGNISAPGVENATRFNIPTAPTPVVANRIVESTPIPPEVDPQVVAQQKQQDQANMSDLERVRKEVLDKRELMIELGLGGMVETMDKLETKGDFTLKAEEEAGIGDKTTALNEINSQIRETELKSRREREAIENNGRLTDAQKNARLDDVSRKQASNLADLSIISATRRDDLTTAQALVDRKVELTFEPLEQKLQFQKMIYEENKDLFNTAEQRQFEIKMRDEQIQIDKDKVKFSMAENLKAQYIMNAAQAGKSNEYLQAIQRAEGQEELFAIPGIQNYSMSQEEKLDQQLTRLNISGASTRNALASLEYQNELLASAQKTALGDGSYVPTGDEDYITGGFALRMTNAEQQVRNFEDTQLIPGGKTPTIAQGAKFRAKQQLPKELQTQEVKSYLQAQENFISAVLRKESGAAISDEEYIREANKYFPQPGDGETVINQKRLSRENATASLLKASKGGYTDLLQGQSQPVGGSGLSSLSDYVDTVTQQTDTFSNWLSDFTLNKN